MTDRNIISFPASIPDSNYFDEIATKLTQLRGRRVSRLGAIRHLIALGRPVADEQLGLDAQPGASFAAQCTTKEGIIATVSMLLDRGFEVYSADTTLSPAASN